MSELVLSKDGFFDVPNSKLAVVVTHLEMLEAPTVQPIKTRSDIKLELQNNIPVKSYKQLFRAVGEDWIWFGRLLKPDEELAAVLHEKSREIYVPNIGGKPSGLLELSFADPENVEIAYFGLIPEAIGGGVGRWLMAQGLGLAWGREETKRVWLHTCTADSPQALKFYLSCGFRPFKRQIEIVEDPRGIGLYETSTASHVPYLGHV